MDHSHVMTSPAERGLTRYLPVFLMAALTAAAANIEIPHQPVPYTLQSLLVLLSGGLLGMRRGTSSQALYLLAGVSGLPVFSQGGAGIVRLLGPTGGYLLAFPVAAFAVGYLLQTHRSFPRVLVAMLVGSFIIFSLGTLQLSLVYFHDLRAAFLNGFLIFSWWDALKIFAAAGIVSAFRKQ